MPAPLFLTWARHTPYSNHLITNKLQNTPCPPFAHKKAAPKDGYELSYLFNIYKPKPDCLLIKFTNPAFLLIRFRTEKGFCVLS